MNSHFAGPLDAECNWMRLFLIVFAASAFEVVQAASTPCRLSHFGPDFMFQSHALAEVAERTSPGGFRAGDEQQQEWTPVSKDPVIGTLVLTPDHISFAGHRFPLTLAREIEPKQLKDLHHDLPFWGFIPSSAFLYKTHISKHALLLNRNHICGPHDVEWILIAYSEDKREMALSVFKEGTEPDLDAVAFDKSTQGCTFGIYDR